VPGATKKHLYEPISEIYFTSQQSMKKQLDREIVDKKSLGYKRKE